MGKVINGEVDRSKEGVWLLSDTPFIIKNRLERRPLKNSLKVTLGSSNGNGSAHCFEGIEKGKSPLFQRPLRSYPLSFRHRRNMTKVLHLSLIRINHQDYQDCSLLMLQSYVIDIIEIDDANLVRVPFGLHCCGCDDRL